MVTVKVFGRIDELDLIDTPEKLKAELADDVEAAKYLPMYQPLGLMPGTYMVTGIEGKFYDGYVSGKRMVEPELPPGPPPSWPANGQISVPPTVWVDDPTNDVPWPLEVTERMSAFDLMVAVSKAEANGYPHVNHVWFEGVTIDVLAMTIKFSMGS